MLGAKCKVEFWMDYQYVLYIDEAGDDKVSSLKPENPNGNSEWLCLGGYLVRAEMESQLDSVRNELLIEIGGRAGGFLHYRNYKIYNREKICRKLSRKPARAFVVCSYKKTMLNYKNPRAAASSTADPRQVLYNFVTRLLLERVTEFVSNDASSKKISNPKLKIVMASRKGHHFGHFKDYVRKLCNQGKMGITYLDVKTIKHEVLDEKLIERIPARDSSGIQLADCVVSAVFQSIEQLNPNFEYKTAVLLKGIFARKPSYQNGPVKARNFGITLYPDAKLPEILTDQLWEFFEGFGYSRNYLLKRTK